MKVMGGQELPDYSFGAGAASTIGAKSAAIAP